ncbi:MAG: gluconeogenesis factor YvcK family protein [Elusimicrobiota bacterium]
MSINSKLKQRVFNLVVIGGGTGLSTLLSGLKLLPFRLTAIVTVTDNGGSSGWLRKEFKVLPPGDIRNCMISLADDTMLLSKLFRYRFKSGRGLKGHSFGNLFLMAMTDIAGTFDAAVTESSRVLAIRGTVLPVTLANVNIGALLSNGKTICGETNITSRGTIEKVFLYPMRTPPAAPRVIDAIRNADAVVLGPGSLFTSIIPNLLVKNVAETLRKSKAPKIYVCNIMTQNLETSGFTLSDHLDALYKHGGYKIINYVLANTGEIPAVLAKRYAHENSYPVVYDKERVDTRLCKILTGNFVSTQIFARHDSVKLAKVIHKIIKKWYNK